MKLYTKRISYLTVILLIPMGTSCCQLTFTNDSPNQVLLISDQCNNATIVNSTKAKKFGDPKERTCMFVLNKPKGSQTFSSQYKVTQYACTKNHKLELSWTALEQGTYDKSVLKVEAHKK